MPRFLAIAQIGKFAAGESTGTCSATGLRDSHCRDPPVDAVVLADLLKARESHDGVVPRALHDGVAGGQHLGPAPRVDGKLGVPALQLGDDRRGVVIAAGLERRKEHRRVGVVSGAEIHGGVKGWSEVLSTIRRIRRSLKTRGQEP
jgi:hypothetical protein